MRRRVEDRIRELCSQAVAEDNPQKFEAIITELRLLLRTHVQNLRKKLSSRPATPERRHIENSDNY